jgi:predicted DNA-binding transcriptional regulator AlpA
MAKHTITTPELAEILGSDPWTVYEHTRRGDFALEPIRCGRKILWPTAAVERLLGLPAGELSREQTDESP